MSNGNSTFVLGELPSSTGLSGLHSLTVHALPGFSAASTVAVGGTSVEAMTAVGGMSLGSSGEFCMDLHYCIRRTKVRPDLQI